MRNYNGSKNPFFGKTHSAETRKKMSDIKKQQFSIGVKMGFQLGHKDSVPNESRKRQGIKMKEFWKNNPEKTKNASLKRSISLTGRKLSPEHILKLKAIDRSYITGENSPNWKGGKPRCFTCQKEISYKSFSCNRHKPQDSEETRQKKGEAQKGEKNWQWKGGISLGKDSGGRLRRMRKKENGGFHTKEEWLGLKIHYGFMCLCCKKSEPEIKLTEDHIIPVSKGGSDAIENIQPLCLGCNVRKSVKVMDYIKSFISTSQ